ncbi:MAG: hypothetical protein M3R16_05225 [Pseudomonadota bacterium]|nr:hypothetical protein [Pseudomonadota bacterium]
MSPRVAAIVAFIGMLVLAPCWMFLVMLGGNGMNGQQGNWLLGTVGVALLVELVAGPWLALRLAQRWQARLGPLQAVVAAVGVAAVLLLVALSLVTMLTFGILIA